MNVRFEYLYRDASNYLQRGSVVFAGPDQLDSHLAELETRLRRVLMVDGTFSAHQIRLPELFLYVGAGPSLDDHCLHEFFGLEATIDQPDDKFGRRFPEFLDEVEHASLEGWLGFDTQSTSSMRTYFRFST
jgi:hypothetical protein